MKYRPRRKTTDFPILLLTETGEQRAEVHDISELGVSVRLQGTAMEIGEVVSIELRDRQYGARVVWARKDEAGLTFNRPLPKDIYALVARERC